MFHLIPVEQPSGIPWASFCLKSSPCFSPGSNEISFWVSRWPTTFHPAECPSGCVHFSLCPGLFGCVLLCSMEYLSQPNWNSLYLSHCPIHWANVHLAFQPWKFSHPLFSFLKRKHQWLRKNLHFLQPKFNSYLLNTYDKLSFVMPSRGLWCSWWNGTDTCKTIWKQRSTVMSVLSFDAKMCGPITAPLTLVRDADMSEDLRTSRLNFIISLWVGYNHPHFSYRQSESQRI